MQIVAIQCAGSKNPGAGTLRGGDGRPVRFVASPKDAPAAAGVLYATPDDLAADGRSWREHLREYNETDATNHLRLLTAGSLYIPPLYRNLVERLGTSRVFILSAGWGLIRSDFLTPGYDITFSAQAPLYARRRSGDRYDDFRMLGPGVPGDEVHFFGGADYLPHFARLTSDFRGRRIAYFKSRAVKRPRGLEMVFYETKLVTNWHYDAAAKFLKNASI